MRRIQPAMLLDAAVLPDHSWHPALDSRKAPGPGGAVSRDPRRSVLTASLELRRQGWRGRTAADQRICARLCAPMAVTMMASLGAVELVVPTTTMSDAPPS